MSNTNSASEIVYACENHQAHIVLMSTQNTVQCIIVFSTLMLLAQMYGTGFRPVGSADPISKSLPHLTWID